MYAATVKAQAASTADSAYFYSYAGNTFAGTPGTTSSLSGTTNNVASQSMNFIAQAAGYKSVTVLESGSDTDVANLTSPGNGTFVEVLIDLSTLAVGTSMITVNTLHVQRQHNRNSVPANRPNATGYAHLNRHGQPVRRRWRQHAHRRRQQYSQAKTATNAITVDDFKQVVEAYQQSGTNDTVVHQSAIDYALALEGTWTNGPNCRSVSDDETAPCRFIMRSYASATSLQRW